MSQTVLGILSDTHGLLRPRVLELLAGSDLILHGGDVGDITILDQLRAVAPVVAVRGNTDTHGTVAELPFTAQGPAGPLTYRMVHRREDIAPHWLREPGLIVFGHSHQPEIEWRGRCLLLNPGACGQRRFHLPLTVARVTIDEMGRMVPEVFRVE
jgi:putative phosphoesterase